MKIEVPIASAFVDSDSGGNPAGVVLGAYRFSSEQKQRIAAAVCLSETAFVSASGLADTNWNTLRPLSRSLTAAMRRSRHSATRVRTASQRTRQRSRLRLEDRISHSQGRHPGVVRSHGDPGGCAQSRTGPRVHQLHIEARGGGQHQQRGLLRRRSTRP